MYDVFRMCCGINNGNDNYVQKESREPDSNQWPRDASYENDYSLPLYQLSYHGILVNFAIFQQAISRK